MKKLLLTLAAFACFFTTYSQDALLVYRQNYAKPLLVALDDITNITYEDAEQIISLEKWNIMSESETTVVDSIVFVNSDTISSTQCAYLVCPNEHHPHMIDLGLPSGILWSCCNVGASAPEEYGGYYSWGETETKDAYNWSTYIHCDGTRENCKDLGSDISGTEYDVAHVKWGEDWQMPSLDQIIELIDNCTIEWTTQNGLNGMMVTGPNGNTMFMSAAADMREDGHNFVGERGSYWASTAKYADDDADYLMFHPISDGSPYWYDDSTLRCRGLSVRPVVTPVTPSVDESYAVYNDGTLTFYHDQSKASREGTVFELNTGENQPGWLEYFSVLTRVVFDKSFANARPTTTYSWFRALYELLTIEGIEYLNTSEVTNMAYMFESADMLVSVDVSHFNTAKVTNMHDMFGSCRRFVSLDVSGFNTENVTDMGGMFEYCYDLASIDVSNFNTEKVTDMNNMFAICEDLTSLDLSSFNTENVTNMDHMFYYCERLTSIDVSSFNTKKVTNMTWMFWTCSALTSLDVSNFDMSSCTNSGEMFKDCSKLESLSVSSTMENLSENACVGIGGENPCTIIAPEGFNFGVDTSGESFVWKGGTFKNAEIPSSNITFADAAVKEICVANWDTNKDGELSYVEAAAVKSLGIVFYEKQGISSFNELQYFTGLTEIEERSFRECSLKSVSIPKGVKTIGEKAFIQCPNLSEVTLPEGVTWIDEEAFAECALTSITLPESLIRLGEQALESNPLISITLPRNVAYLGNADEDDLYDGVFDFCYSLKEVNVNETNETYASIDGVLTTKDKKILLFYPYAKGNDYEVPEGIEQIHYKAFNDCMITSVTLPSTLKSFYMDEYARPPLSYCFELRTVRAKMKVPFECDEYSFSSETYSSGTLHVPQGTKALYEATAGWSSFRNIVEDSGD